jgi:hypothetical protein
MTKRKDEIFIDASDQPRRERLFVRVSNNERQRYEFYAKQHGVSLSEIIRKGLEVLTER